MQTLHSNIIAQDLIILAANTLIISDIHIGYEESLNKQGILVPRVFFKETMGRTQKSIESIIKIKKSKIRNNKKKDIKQRRKEDNSIKENKKEFDAIVLNGDLKDEFGNISETEWRYAIRFFDYLSKYSERIIIVKGNHDLVIGPIAKKRNVEVVDFFEFTIDNESLERKPSEKVSLEIFKKNNKKIRNELNILVAHGDDIPKREALKKANIIIIGHIHPAVQIQDSIRSETYKCYLVGKYKNKTLIVQPSSNLATEGTNLLKQKTKSPFLTDDVLWNYEVFVVGDKIYKFGKLGMIGNSP